MWVIDGGQSCQGRDVQFVRENEDVLSVVHVSSVTHTNNKCKQVAVFHQADYPVSTDSIFPEILKLLTERVTKTPRVLIGCNFLPEMTNDTSLKRSTQLFDIFHCFVFPFNSPDQVPFLPPLSSSAFTGFLADSWPNSNPQSHPDIQQLPHLHS